MDLYSARIHQLSGAQGALLPLLIRLINHLSSLGSIQLNCCHYSAYRANQPTLPSQVPIWPLGGEKQLWLSVLLKDTSVTARIRTHILLLTPELESGKLDRSATTLHMLSPSLWHCTQSGHMHDEHGNDMGVISPRRSLLISEQNGTRTQTWLCFSGEKCASVLWPSPRHCTPDYRLRTGKCMSRYLSGTKYLNSFNWAYVWDIFSDWIHCPGIGLGGP